jgi:hypothetical protein
VFAYQPSSSHLCWSVQPTRAAHHVVTISTRNKGDRMVRWSTLPWSIICLRSVQKAIQIDVVDEFDPVGLTTEQWSERAQQRQMFMVESVQTGWRASVLAVEQATSLSGWPLVRSTRRGGSTPTIFWPGFAIQHDLLRCGALGAVCSSGGGAAAGSHQARPVCIMWLSSRHDEVCSECWGTCDPARTRRQRSRMIHLNRCPFVPSITDAS